LCTYTTSAKTENRDRKYPGLTGLGIFASGSFEILEGRACPALCAANGWFRVVVSRLQNSLVATDFIIRAGYTTTVMRTLNRNFYKFLFSFMGIIAVTLILIIIVGTVGA
jgi:hypothetical protein